MIDFDLAPGGSGSPFRGSRPLFIDDEFEAEVNDFEPLSMETPNERLPSYLKILNLKQKEAALAIDGPVIVLAGAGSGKTRMLTARIAYLLEHCKVAPYQILAVTFTNKAAAEMRERVHAAIQGYVSQPDVGTFHSICVKILRREMQHLPFTKPFVIYDDSDQLSLIKSVMSKLNVDTKQIKPKAVQGFINRLKCDAVEPDDFEPSHFSRFEKKVEDIYHQYQKDLFANNALDFGEILCLTYRLLRDQEKVRKRYQTLYRYIHVDEYQDTNRVQYLLLTCLASKSYGGHENICVVGDEDQSIYKWRGADIRNILDFEHDYHNATVIKLEQNYRSTQNIISAASSVISHNTERKDKVLWTENDEGESIMRYQLPDERMEAETVIKEIKRLTTEQGVALDEMAILYRTHAQSRQFEDLFRREKIPYQMIGGIRFYDRKEIKDVLSYLKVLLNPLDSVSLKRIINVPARGIGKTTIDRLENMMLNEAEFGESPSLWQVIEHSISEASVFSARVKNKLGHFYGLIQKLQSKVGKHLVSEIYHDLLDLTGYVTDLKKEQSVEADARIENLEELDNLIKEFEEEMLAKKEAQEREALMPSLLLQFIERSTLVSSTDESMDLSSVKMMTLHGCKGLEFPVVFMVGLEEGLFPSIRPWEETPPEEIEEERRLCYVGMTRARKKLFITNALSRRVWGSYHYHDPARFLAEIPDQYVTIRDLTEDRSNSGLYGGSGFFEDSTHVVSDHYLMGQEVQHPRYGKGKVVDVTGSGESEKAVIQFSGGLRKKFLTRFINPD